MKNKKQYILSIILFLFLLIGTYYFVLRDYSLNMFIDSIKNCKVIYIIMAFGCVFLYSFFASLYTKRMFYHFNKRINWYQAFGYLFTEVYFSAITPSSIGGQPIQMIEMKKDGVDYQINSVVVLLHTAIYKICLLILATLAFLLFYDDIFSQNRLFVILFSFGYITTLLLILFMIALIYSKRLIPKIIDILIFLGSKLHIVKDKEKLKIKVNEAISGYQRCAKFTKDNPKILIESFFILLFQRLSLLSISYLIYKSFGFNTLSYAELISFQVCLTLACDFVPTPGGVAISEGLLLQINKFIYGSMFATSAMILLRGISFYLFILFCGIFYVFFHFIKRHKAIDIKKSN